MRESSSAAGDGGRRGRIRRRRACAYRAGGRGVAHPPGRSAPRRTAGAARCSAAPAVVATAASRAVPGAVNCVRRGPAVGAESLGGGAVDADEDRAGIAGANRHGLARLRCGASRRPDRCGPPRPCRRSARESTTAAALRSSVPWCPGGRGGGRSRATSGVVGRLSSQPAGAAADSGSGPSRVERPPQRAHDGQRAGGGEEADERARPIAPASASRPRRRTDARAA